MAAAILLMILLPSLYITAYLVLIERAIPFASSGIGPVIRRPTYGVRGEFIEWAFRPAVMVDYWWQPEAWEDWGVPARLNPLMNLAYWQHTRPDILNTPELAPAWRELEKTLNEARRTQAERDCYTPKNPEYAKSQRRLDACADRAIAAYEQLQRLARQRPAH